jgi:hypothetical protein
MMKKKFKSADGQLFQVSEVVQLDKELIVHYTKISTGENYSCLLEAFSERFKPTEEE